MAHEVFISHASLDKPVADGVCAALERANIRCWIAPRDVQPGRSFAGEITRAIQQSKVMVLIFSAHSNQSDQVLREVQLAANSHLHIVQFRIQDVLPNEDLEYYLSAPHWLDALTPPLERNLERLSASVKALLQMSGENLRKRAPVELETEKDHDVTATRPPVTTPKQMPANVSLRLSAGISRVIAGIRGLWNKNQLAVVAGGIALLLLFALPALFLITRRSMNSSAEKEYTGAFLLAEGFNTTKIDTAKAAEWMQRVAEKRFPEAEAHIAYWLSNGNGGLVKDNVKAEQWAKRALAHGLTNKAETSAAARTELAVLYMAGLGVLKDEAKAAELLQNPAEQGYPRAQTALGLLYQNGQGVPKNPGKAAALFQKAANQGYADAQNDLAGLYYNGEGVPKDLTKAVQFYKKAADQGNASAQNHLGFMYQNGQGVPKDIGKAVDLYQRSADQGHSGAQTNLGYLRQYGQGVPKDLSKAADYYQKAANLENPIAENNLGYLYQNGQGVPKDYGKAVDLYQRAINHGNITARNNLGWMYQNGQGVPKDLAKAAELYQSAANAGYVDAENNLGFLYYNGQGVARDLTKAAELLQKAADGGNTSAQNQLASMYYKGEGVNKDWGKAATLYAKAASQGSFTGQTRLGLLYQTGQGVTRDLAKAVELYQKAANGGYVDAEVNLASLYENGEGVTKDLGKATELYRKAAAQHNQTAIASLQRLSTLATVNPTSSSTPASSQILIPPPTPMQISTPP